MKRIFAVVILLCLVVFGTFKIYKRIQRSQTASLQVVRDAPVLQRIATLDPLLHMSEITCPVWMDWGTSDTIVPPDQNEVKAAALIPNCETVVMPGMKHGSPECFDSTKIIAFMQKYVPTDTAIILLHGAGQTGLSWYADDPKAQKGDFVAAHHRLYNALAKAGYKLETGDFGGDHWGNPASVSLLEQTIKTRKVALVAVSMGGLLAWNYTERHPKQVSAIVAISPVCSLSNLANGSYHNAVVAAYR